MTREGEYWEIRSEGNLTWILPRGLKTVLFLYLKRAHQHMHILKGIHVIINSIVTMKDASKQAVVDIITNMQDF